MIVKKEKLRIGITLGDVSGIGPEIIMKTFADEQIYKHFTPILFGNPRVLSYYKKAIEGVEKFQYTTVKGYGNLSNNSLNIIPVWEEEFQINIGQPTETTGKYAFKSLAAACSALKDGNIDVLITAPINKKYINSSEFAFAGHTDYLKQYFGANEVLMLMSSDKIKLGLVTDHVPIKEVASKITKDKILRKLHILNATLIEDFGIDKPRIAVLGLNPHAGDGGLIGTEDRDIILPAVNDAKNDGMVVFGPYPADGFFASGAFAKFDGILAMYHDQGLIPFKYIAGEEGINYTAGLKVIRTSPDHGTAEDIAGKSIADENSFRQAIYAAIDIFRNRENFYEMRSNPLVKRAKFQEER